VLPKLSAAELDLEVFKRLEEVSNSLKKSAQRYEATIEKLDETIQVCELTEKKIKKTKRKRDKQLNEGFQVIVRNLRRAGVFRPVTAKDSRRPWR